MLPDPPDCAGPLDCAATPALLRRLGWDATWAACWPGTGSGNLLDAMGCVVEPARVVRADRGACDLLGGEGPVRATWGADVVAVSATDPEATPATGDWVVLARWCDGRCTVERVLPRRTALTRAQVARGSSYGQVLAANVDVVAVVEALVPEPDLGRIERLLALAWDGGARPVVVLTKADLVVDGLASDGLDGHAAEAAAGLVAEISAAARGCQVVTASSATGQGLQEIRGMLTGGMTLALVGASGVGKSTLLNALVGAAVMRTRGLRSDAKGRHTTVTRELHLIEGGTGPDGSGALIDTPGLRSIGPLDQRGVAEVFADIGRLRADQAKVWRTRSRSRGDLAPQPLEGS